MEKELPLYIVLMPLATSVIAVLVTLLTIFIKERLEHQKNYIAANSILLMFARSMQRVLSLSPEFAKHVEIGHLSSFLPEIAVTPKLSSIYDSLEETYLLWRQGSFSGRLAADPLIKHHNTVLLDCVTKLYPSGQLLVEIN